MSFILKLLSGSSGIWLLLASMLASASAGGWAVHKLHQASHAKELSAALEKRDANDKKSTQAEVTVNRLPDGVASQRLFLSWSRNTD